MARRTRPIATALATVIALASSARAAHHADLSGFVRFDEVRTKLTHAKGSTVATVCGTTVAPWAYRGPRGDSLELKARIRTEQSERWAHDFASTLMVEASWDSTHRFRGHPKLCRDTTDVPLFVVSWHLGSDDIYALLDFEARGARVFSANRPLGTMWFRDRADAVFTAVRAALAADSSVAAMRLPAETAPSPEERAAVPDTAWVKKLPEATRKVPPYYPDEARVEGRQGTVRVQALVGADGAVHDAYIMESVRGLDDAALACVWDWQFNPAQGVEGPVAVWVQIPIKFSLR